MANDKLAGKPLNETPEQREQRERESQQAQKATLKQEEQNYRAYLIKRGQEAFFLKLGLEDVACELGSAIHGRPVSIEEIKQQKSSATPEQSATNPEAAAKKTARGATPEQPRALREFFAKASDEEFTKICNLLRDRYKQARRPIDVIKILRELQARGYDVQPSRQKTNFARELSLLVTAGENPDAISRQVIADGLRKANDKGEALEINALLK